MMFLIKYTYLTKPVRILIKIMTTWSYYDYHIEFIVINYEISAYEKYFLNINICEYINKKNVFFPQILFQYGGKIRVPNRTSYIKKIYKRAFNHIITWMSKIMI